MFLLWPLYQILWNVIIRGPLALIAVFEEVIRKIGITLPFAMLVKKDWTGGNGELDVPSFSLSGIPTAFWAMCILALFVMIVLFVINYFNWALKDDGTTNIKQNLIGTLKVTGKSIVMVLLMPFLMYLMLVLCAWMSYLLVGAVDVDNFATGQTSGDSLAKIIYWIGSPASYMNDQPSSGWGMPSSWQHINWIVQIVAVLMMLYTMAMTAINLTVKVFEMFALFIFGPLVASMAVQDNFEALKKWKSQFIGKAIVIATTLMSYSLFAYGLMAFKNAFDPEAKQNFVVYIFGMLVGMTAGGTFMMTLPSMIAGFFCGESVEKQNLFGGLMAAKGAAAGVGAFGMGAAGAVVGKSKIEAMKRDHAAKKEGKVKQFMKTGGGAGSDGSALNRDGAPNIDGGDDGAAKKAKLGGLVGAATVLGGLGLKGAGKAAHGAGRGFKKMASLVAPKGSKLHAWATKDTGGKGARDDIASGWKKFKAGGKKVGQGIAKGAKSTWEFAKHPMQKTGSGFKKMNSAIKNGVKSSWHNKVTMSKTAQETREMQNKLLEARINSNTLSKAKEQKFQAKIAKNDQQSKEYEKLQKNRQSNKELKGGMSKK